MKNAICLSRLSNRQPTPANDPADRWRRRSCHFTDVDGQCSAQNPTPANPLPAPETQVSVPVGYSLHQTVDLGGRMTGIVGSGAMYDTLVNLQSGPRVQGETFELRALPGTKNTLVDNLRAFGTGFGGDPNSFTKLDFSKGKIYEFSGIFRRDRQYFDYDLLGNPNIPTGESIPIGPKNAPTGSYAWPQVNQSPVLFNTVRRMTDTNLTIFPLSKVTYRVGYSQNIFQGPSLSPSGYQFAKYDAILQEYQRNSTDDFLGGIDWKPIHGTKLTFEEQIDHYKADSYFTMAPGDFNVQEADGTLAALDDFDSQTAVSEQCLQRKQHRHHARLSAPQTAGGLPVINAACDVVTSYLRSQPTRIIYPTEIFRLQSSTIKNLAMNGDLRYMNGNMNLPNYYDSYQGLNGTTRSLTYTGVATAKREVLAADYGVVWNATKTFSLADQVTFSSTHQPGTTTMTSGTTLATPATANNETINFAGPLTTTNAAAGASTFEGSGAVGTPLPGYFGQNFLTNNLTGTWDAGSRTTLSLTYRYDTHTIAQGSPHNAPLAVGATSNGTVTINENGAILNAAVRPAANWSVNGTVEALYADNAFTPVGARQTRHYRVHTLYRPKPWATISGALTTWSGITTRTTIRPRWRCSFLLRQHQLQMEPPHPVPRMKARSIMSITAGLSSLGAVLSPNEHYGLDFDYAYSDVYSSTNICYLNGATATLPGAVQSATSTVCPNIFGRGATGVTEANGTALSDWFARDFMRCSDAVLHRRP